MYFLISNKKLCFGKSKILPQNLYQTVLNKELIYINKKEKSFVYNKH